MKLMVNKGAPLQQKTPCLVLGVIEGQLKTPLLQQLDKSFAGALARATRTKEFTGSKGQSLLLHAAKGLAAERVLLLGLGKENSVDLVGLRRAASRAAQLLAEKQVASFVLGLAQVPVKKSTLAERLQAVAEGVWLANYRYDRYLTKPAPDKPVALTKVTLLIESTESQSEA